MRILSDNIDLIGPSIPGLTGTLVKITKCKQSICEVMDSMRSSELKLGRQKLYLEGIFLKENCIRETRDLVLMLSVLIQENAHLNTLMNCQTYINNAN